jgi:hypothetical protein
VFVPKGRDPQLDGFDVEIHDTRKTCTVQEKTIVAEFGGRVSGLRARPGHRDNV